MTLYLWFVFFLAVQVIHFIGTWKLYEAAGRKSWEAAIPVYNAIVLMKIIGRPTWWTLLLFIPIINLIMFPVIWVETLRTFGKKSTLDTILGIFTFGFYIYYVNYTQKLEYNANRSLTPENKTADTISSLLFAIIVATLVHTYVVQPYTIPSSSLEKSLLIGDFLFVSKVNYGPRVPMTTVALPMVHDTIPFAKVKSYLSWPQLPYFRLPALEKIKNNDIVVFNWPRDTAYNMYIPADKFYYKPIDKKTNYVKRCVGIPGDSLQIKDGIVFINGKELILPERAKPQYSYKVAYDGKTPIDFESLLRELDITDGAYFTDQEKKDTLYFRALTQASVERLKNTPGITGVKREIVKGPEDGIFPDFQDGKPSTTNNWSCDNMGPIYIPQAGKTVALTTKTLPLYKEIISNYEGNKLEVKGSEILINGKPATTYTFKQDYYWMMGDNRHNSLDARYFGYTPADHIVGKPVFIWMSWDTNGKGINKVRWNRVFTTVDGEGQPQSYFKYFLIVLALYFVGEFFWRKRKENKA
ncbi:signal peptidase I [Flavobacterium cutihirudinis]|uniref:Signal peptidase I n=1 Tax=Flavobacterium cutihirudinis TaxID=1265740 RepID=A0A3D9FKG6_9FLAO|nr:signal peptidase I [Flavobacterium cutihirudinis]RED19477.1 signal peptidase I [Flavobacterium cutihirudinis]